MAYEIGTASGHYDLLAKIKVFVEATLPVSQRYTVLRNIDTGDDREVIWKAPGLIGSDGMYLGLKTYQSVTSDYYNFKIGVFTGYVESSPFEAQPGTCTIKGIPLWNAAIPYWIVASSIGFVFFAKVENVYTSGIAESFFKYNTPFQYPYGVCCGGSLATDSATRYSDTSYNNWFMGGAEFELRPIDGAWESPSVWPVQASRTMRNTTTLSTTAEGYYRLHPLILFRADPDTFGEISNVFFISGFNNAVENSFLINSVPYIVMRNVWRVGFKDYVALRLQ